MNFSERNGYKGSKTIQVESVNKELRTGLWNAFHITFFTESLDFLYNHYPQTKFAQSLWINYLNRPIDELNWSWNSVLKKFKEDFFNCPWNEVYDFIEFTANNYPISKTAELFIANCQKVLIKEVSGYRFVNKQIVPIVSEVALLELDKALQSPLKAVQIHLKTALELFSDRKSPDYRNSIKESISAVEAICCIITCRPKAQLGDAIKKVKEVIPIHGALESAFDKLYGYTSDEEGVRHKLLEESNVEAEDALFMLLACTAFTNYLTTKIGRAGIKLK